MYNCLYRNGRYGGVAARVLICAASLVVLGGAIVTLLKTFEARKAEDYRRAEVISAYGIQEAFGKLAGSIEWDAGFKDEPYPFSEEGGDGGRYSVIVTRETLGDSLRVKIVSTGTVGSVSQTQTEERVIPRNPQAVSGEDAPEGIGGEGKISGEEPDKNPAAESEDLL